MSVEPETVRPRRRFGLRIRGLMVVVLLIGLGLGWAKHRIRSQQEAVEAIEKVGGQLTFDYFRSPRRSKWKSLLMQLVGRSNYAPLMHDVIELTILNDENNDEILDDSSMPYLARFSKLESLEIQGYPHHITGSSLRHLRNLTHLEILKLDETPLGDAGLSSLSNLKKLRVLDLMHLEEPGPGIGDDGLRHLAGLNALEELYLAGHRRITDSGLMHIEEMMKLKFLYLGSTRISGAGLFHLRRLRNLTELSLDGTAVTDVGLVHLSELAGLTYLSLSGTRITDTGLIQLSGLTNLTELFLDGTAVTDEGMAKIARLPSLAYLGLGRTSVGDAGVLRFKGHAKLQALKVGSRISSDCEAEMKKASPLRIYIFH